MSFCDAGPRLALSVRQPWAWAIIHAGKDMENRTKRSISLGRMDVRERIAIHASGGMTREEYEDARDFMATLGVECPRPDQLIRSALIGTVDVVGVTKQSESRWFFGPWALQLADPQPEAVPLPCSGELGLFDWTRAGRRALDVAADPLPWMVAWPDPPARARKPVAVAEGPMLL